LRTLFLQGASKLANDIDKLDDRLGATMEKSWEEVSSTAAAATAAAAAAAKEAGGAASGSRGGGGGSSGKVGTFTFFCCQTTR
jgi:hypothetical protein